MKREAPSINVTAGAVTMTDLEPPRPARVARPAPGSPGPAGGQHQPAVPDATARLRPGPQAPRLARLWGCPRAPASHAHCARAWFPLPWEALRFLSPRCQEARAAEVTPVATKLSALGRVTDCTSAGARASPCAATGTGSPGGGRGFWRSWGSLCSPSKQGS